MPGSRRFRGLFVRLKRKGELKQLQEMKRKWDYLKCHGKLSAYETLIMIGVIPLFAWQGGNTGFVLGLIIAVWWIFSSVDEQRKRDSKNDKHLDK